ncbi:DUF4135 domain-containing protein [Staphylococcus epidermidis]|uniref:DUF4135 domain-containing protein n=1 Tax=Staphylococcus epidermidis TaxID=1282 RepID=UPI003457F62A
MNKIDIIEKSYNEYDFSEANDFLSFLYSPIHIYLAKKEFNDDYLYNIYVNNQKKVNIHLNNLVVDSAIFYINEQYRNYNYKSILSMLKNIEMKEFVFQFYDNFSGLWDLILKYIYECINNYKTIYSLIRNNSEAISTKFSINVENLVDIKVGEGDRHLNYIPTTKIIFKSKIIYFKNRKEDFEQLFTKIYNLFSSQKIKLNSLIIDEGYFQEEIPQAECYDKTFPYINSGTFLFVSYLLGISDLHEENIIFSKQGYIPIDCETIFANDRYFDSEQKGTNYNLRNSVLSTGLIPFRSIKGAVISGLNSFKEQTINTSDYRLRITRESIYKEQVEKSYLMRKKNIPKNFTNMNFLENISYIDKGFKEAYLLFLKHKEDYINKISNIFQHKVSRVLHQNTAFYYEVLQNSYHPYLLLSQTRESFFNDFSILNPLEKNHLFNDFIPIDQKNINISKNFFKKFSKEDLYLQLSIIHQSFISEKGFYLKRYEKDTLRKSSIDNITQKFLNQINNTTIYYRGELIVLDSLFTGEKQNDYGFEVIILPKEYYLGTSGLLLYLSKIINRNDYVFPKKKCYQMYNDLAKYVNKYKYSNEIKLGYYDGIAGILHVLFKLRDWSPHTQDEEQIIEVTTQVVKNYINKKHSDLELDIINSVFGFIYFLSTIYYEVEYKNKYKIENLLSQLLKHIVCNINIEPNNSYFGFAHGISGVIFVLLKANHIINSLQIKKIVDYLYHILNSNYTPSQLNWQISTKNSDTPINWCHGSPGIILAYLNKYNKINDKTSIQIVKSIINYNHSNICLCHGIVGNYQILKYINKFNFSILDFKNSIENILLINRHKIYNNENLYKYSKSYMVGLTGVLDIIDNRRPIKELF